MSMIDFCKRNTALKYLTILIFTSLTLSACGLSGDRGGTDGRTATGSNSNGDVDDGGHFDFKQKIGIRVERINGEVDEVAPSQISIVSLDQNFRETGSGSTPSYRVEKRLIGGYEIQLASSYIERVNQVVKVTFNNRSTPKEILYAPLYTLTSETESITVNAKSHYLLKKLFDSVDTSDQLSSLLPCSNSTPNCINQSMAKANTLQLINFAVSEYHVDIPTTATVTQAIDLLDQRVDLKRHVESAVNEITRTTSPFAKGIRRSQYELTSIQLPVHYHSVLFGLSFSNVKPDDDNRSVKVSSFSSTIINNTESAYPGFNQNTTLLDMRRDVLSSDIPFERTSLTIAQDNSFSLIDNESVNYLTSAQIDSRLSTEGFLLNERVIEQAILGDFTTSSAVGWEFEPLFTRSYQTNEYEAPTDGTTETEPDYGFAPTWLVSSNYSKTASYQLSGTLEKPKREEQLEDAHLFSWEVHGLETNKDPGFSLSPMNNKKYGVINLSLKLDDTDNSNVMQVIAETAHWAITSSNSTGQIQITQPTNHYQTFSLSRDDNNSTVGVRTETNLIESPRTITRLETDDNGTSTYQGLVSFGGLETGKPQGHATTNGSYMALAFNTKDKSNVLDRGQGLILASELSTSNYPFSGEVYQIQGNSIEMTTDHNILHQLNGTTLHINPTSATTCLASLSVRRLSLSHSIDSLTNTLDTPIETTQNDITSQTCTTNKSEIHIEFSSVFGEPLILRGFITHKNDEFSTEPGNLINLIWQQNNQLGLIFANKEQNLSPSFDE